MFPNIYGFNSGFYDPYYQNQAYQTTNYVSSFPYQNYYYPSFCNNQAVGEKILQNYEALQNIIAPIQPIPAQIQPLNSTSEKKQKKRRGLDKFKQKQSAKKNSQSNITNQYFSYYSNRQLSYPQLSRCIRKLNKTSQQQQKIISIFYNIMQCISSQRGKKYVNRKTIMNFFFADTIIEQIPKLDRQINKLGFISLIEICKIIRQCCFNYLRFDCTLNVISSKRISQASKGEHLKRRRIIQKNVLNLMSQNCIDANQ